MSKHAASEAETKLTTTLSKMGVEMTHTTPVGGVDPSKPAWPHISYTVTLTRNGNEFYCGPYKLGVGHVSIPKALAHETPFRMLSPEKQSDYAAQLAMKQGVKPTLAGVMSSLLSDGEAFFNAQPFEDWCAELGYDTDSRKAEAIYKACDHIGRRIAWMFNIKELATLREMGGEL